MNKYEFKKQYRRCRLLMREINKITDEEAKKLLESKVIFDMDTRVFYAWIHARRDCSSWTFWLIPNTRARMRLNLALTPSHRGHKHVHV